jgi:hypothetical protein
MRETESQFLRDHERSLNDSGNWQNTETSVPFFSLLGSVLTAGTTLPEAHNLAVPMADAELLSPMKTTYERRTNSSNRTHHGSL